LDSLFFGLDSFTPNHAFVDELSHWIGDSEAVCQCASLPVPSIRGKDLVSKRDESGIGLVEIIYALLLVAQHT
jgi:hypothetical protein